MATSVRPSQPKPRAKSRVNDDSVAEVDNAPKPDAPNITGVKRNSIEALLDDSDSILNPKVMVPYATKPGEVPRKVQIERKKRLYETVSIEELLRKEGLRPDDMDFDNKKLPLYLFDDTSFETRFPHQWVDKVERVPALAGVTSFEGKSVWKSCIVTDFLEDSNSYLVQWGDIGHTSWLPRIQVHFQAEDPFLFVKRVKVAQDARNKAEAQLKYNCYIKAMPVEDRTYMSPEQLERVKAKIYNTKFMKEKKIELTALLTEVNTDYGKVMNKLTFDDTLKCKPSSSDEFIVDMEVEFPPDETKSPIPRLGTVEVPQYDYEELASEFYFMSCLTRPEVIVATVKLRSECNKIPKMTLLSSHYIKSMRLDEFESMETQTAEQALLHLKESWLTLLRNIIRTSFKDAGKGWFNIKEASLEAYRASKMKRYLTMVRYIMEDALRYLVQETLERYTVFLEKQCGSPIVEIIDTDEVNYTWPQQDFSSMVKKPPLFALEIVTAEGGIFEYNTQIKNFEEVVVRALEFAVKCIQSIPQLEASIMENQFWSKVPNLSTPMLEEPIVQALKGRVQVAIRKAMTVARLYLDKYVEFEPLLKLDVPKYKVELIGKKLSLKDLLEEVRAHKAEQDNIDRRIPNSISFGAFQIICKKIRQFLLQKKQQLVDIVMQLIASTPKQLGQEKLKRFEELEKQLKVKTHNPEEVAAQRDFILTVPGKVIELKQETEQLEASHSQTE
ncbi:hypothetical protein R1flu_022045 [Riccia fluitans]|uniref:Uncharacterized protein n=1 Tax=Riccia fluitans TaxID=41844 RepID=A0ABD1ZS84_9MARC